MTREVMERMLWLSLLEKPWEEARLGLRDELERMGMTHDDLLFELRRDGYKVARSTLGAWLRGEGQRAQGPPVEGLRAIVAVVARAGLGDSAKPEFLSSLGMAYAPRTGPAESHTPEYRLPKRRMSSLGTPKSAEGTTQHPPSGGQR